MSNFAQQVAQAQAAVDAVNQQTSGYENQSQHQVRSRPERISLGRPIRILVFVVIKLLCVAAGALLFVDTKGLSSIIPIVGFFVAIVLTRMIRVVAQWEQGVVLRLGRFISQRGPGLNFIFPVIDYMKIIDMRVQTLEIPRQRVITRDNVPVAINGVLYFKVMNIQDSIIKVQDFEFAILQYSQAALRDVVGRLSLDELLAERDHIQKEIEEAIEKHARDWGLEVDALRLQDIDMPEDLKRMMSRQASAEREKRATITKAEGDKLAAFNLAEAAQTMHAAPGAMQLRTLQTLDSLGASPSNTVVFTLPTDFFEAVKKYAGRTGQTSPTGPTNADV